MDLKPKKIKQSSGLGGPASLSSLLDFYGVRMSERELASLTGASKQYGTEPHDLPRVLENLGFKAVAKQHGTWSDLKKLTDGGTPVIVNWWPDAEKPADGHYSVVYQVTQETVHMMDPALGAYRHLGKERFMKQWYGFYLTGEKNDRWYVYIT